MYLHLKVYGISYTRTYIEFRGIPRIWTVKNFAELCGKKKIPYKIPYSGIPKRHFRKHPNHSKEGFQVSERGIEKGARGISKGKKRARGLRHVYRNLYMCI